MYVGILFEATFSWFEVRGFGHWFSLVFRIAKRPSCHRMYVSVFWECKLSDPRRGMGEYFVRWYTGIRQLLLDIGETLIRPMEGGNCWGDDGLTDGQPRERK